MALFPNVYRANSMAKELQRAVNFDIVLVPVEKRGTIEAHTEVWVKVYNQTEDTVFLWDKNRFVNRYYGMQEMYQNFTDGETNWNLPKDRDPFYDPSNRPELLGNVAVYLQPLAYLVEYDEHLPIVDLTGHEQGQLAVALIPCNTDGNEIHGEYVQDPKELIGKNLSFKVKLLTGLGLPLRVDQSWCQYRFFTEPDVKTDQFKGAHPVFAHETLFTYRPVTAEVMEYLAGNKLYISIFMTQKSKISWKASKVENESTMKSNASLLPVNDNASKINRVEKLITVAKNADSKNISMKSLETVLEGKPEETGEEEKASTSKKGPKRLGSKEVKRKLPGPNEPVHPKTPSKKI